MLERYSFDYNNRFSGKVDRLVIAANSLNDAKRRLDQDMMAMQRKYPVSPPHSLSDLTFLYTSPAKHDDFDGWLELNP